MTRWAAVPVLPAYEVSDDGRFRKGDKPIRAFDRGDGYIQVGFRTPGRKHNRMAHRVVAIAFLGDAPSPDHLVAHGDGNPGNNRVENLRWALPSENSADMVRHGRSLAGERNPQAVVSDALAARISHAFAGGRSMSSLARELAVSIGTIKRAIARGQGREVHVALREGGLTRDFTRAALASEQRAGSPGGWGGVSG